MLDGFVLPLAAQAIPRICSRFGIEFDSQEDIFPPGANEEDIDRLNRRRELMLDELSKSHGVSMWDLFDESGIGQERNAISKDFVSKGSSTLDVATGRGYFAFASARRGCQVTAVDVMDGERRAEWWRVFTQSSRTLGLEGAVGGVRADGANLPFVPGSFKVASCIHAIRNLLDSGELERIVKELHKLTAMDGQIVLAESSTEAESPAEEVYLAYLRLRAKIGWEAIPPNKEELNALLEASGFSKISTTVKRFDRDYAPVEFPAFIISGQPPKIREEHDRIERLRLTHGIKPPSVNIVSGKVQI